MASCSTSGGRASGNRRLEDRGTVEPELVSRLLKRHCAGIEIGKQFFERADYSVLLVRRRDWNLDRAQKLSRDAHLTYTAGHGPLRQPPGLVLQEELLNPFRPYTLLRSNRVELRRTETHMPGYLGHNRCLAVFRARRDLRHDHVAGKKRRVALLHLTVAACFRVDQTGALGRHGPHRDESHLGIVVDDTPIESRIDGREPAERRCRPSPWQSRFAELTHTSRPRFRVGLGLMVMGLE